MWSIDLLEESARVCENDSVKLPCRFGSPAFYFSTQDAVGIGPTRAKV